jgi:serine protease inhibitor
MKSNILKYLLIFLVSLTILSCRDNATNPGDPGKDLTAAQKQTIESSNRFGFTLFGAMNSANTTANVLVSPLSVSMALGMTLNGANNATYDSMRHALGFESLTNDDINKSYQGVISLLTALDPMVTFNIANSIWYRQEFSVRSEFVSVNKQYFGSEVNPLNFNDPGAASTINDWVNTATHGKIPAIVDSPISPDAVMFLINAIYFKGTWIHQFDTLKTTKLPFTVPVKGPAPAPMMKQETTFLYYQNSALQMVDLPYGQGDYRMTIVLPAAGTDINAFVTGLNPGDWSTWIAGLDSARVELSLPRFKFDCDYLLNDALKSMGMGIAFTPYVADFSRISTTSQLFINKVKHKTYIGVSEEGTEAAAVTSVEMFVTSVPPVTGAVIMNVNRPFVFVIRDGQSGTLMFIGKVIDPS